MIKFHKLYTMGWTYSNQLLTFSEFSIITVITMRRRMGAGVPAGLQIQVFFERRTVGSIPTRLRHCNFPHQKS